MLFLLLVAFEIHLVFPESLIGVKTDLICLMSCLTKSRSYSGNFALFQTLLFGYINVVFNYEKLFGASAVEIQVKIIFGFLYFEQASHVNTIILGFIVSLYHRVLPL
ncbi:hypothetical protein HID58_048931 [Brassica napus]|uniref:Uncharacterized protein n=1 Tax=Brassica napus TaxID=3708 RepID=A0ABQ8B4J2_BRANA|nr:hypothetical protein HID58_048931 [Brassica napus]